MDVILEEKRHEEGKELAYELIRHGVRYQEIAKVMEVDPRMAFDWLKKVERTGWTSDTQETYDDPKELTSKMEKLKEYKGLYTKQARDRRRMAKQELARTLYEQGVPMKEISQKVNIAVQTLYEWGIAEPQQPDMSWIENWKRDWDAFMRSLVRPIRLEGKLYVE